jgi:hypothetical protein
MNARKLSYIQNTNPRLFKAILQATEKRARRDRQVVPAYADQAPKVNAAAPATDNQGDIASSSSNYGNSPSGPNYIV